MLVLSDFFCYSAQDIICCFFILSALAFVVLLSSLHWFSYPHLAATVLNLILFVLVAFFFLPNVVAYSLSLTAYYGSLGIDLSSFTFRVITLIVAFFVLFVSKSYAARSIFYEVDILIFCSIYALTVVVSANDFLVFYLGIELQSLAFYCLVSANSIREGSIEAGLKYFVVGALSSCVLLFGIALIYATFGSFSFDALVELSHLDVSSPFYFGSALLICSILFKLGMVPFHMWLIDVYEGSVTSLTLFFSTVPKVVLVLALIKILYLVLSH